MGFGTDLQGRSSHDALLHVQDTEIRLLETFKKCMTQRIYADKEYATALGTVVNTAVKLDIQQYDSPVFKAWKTLVEQTEQLQKCMQQNTERMCTKTLESLITLINDKRTARKTYADERQRLEVEFAKLQEDVQKSKGEYEKQMEKVTHDRAKYEDMHRKVHDEEYYKKMQGKVTKRFEEAKAKYSKSTGKLHRAHNDYILLLKEVTHHQKHYLQNTLPSLLDYQETCLQSLVKQCQDVFREYEELTDSSSAPFTQCHASIMKSIAAVNYKEEYNDFLNKQKTAKLEASKFEFDKNIMDVYNKETGKLKADQIATDDATFENLKHRQKSLQERLDGVKQKKDNKTKEMNAINVKLAEQAASEYNNDPAAKAVRNAQEKTWQVLNREVTELQCQESKLQAVFDVVTRSMSGVSEAALPEAIQLDDAPPPPEPDPNDTSQTNGAIGFNLPGMDKLRDTIGKIGKSRSQKTPPKPPSIGEIVYPQPNGDDRPYEDEVIHEVNNHQGDTPPERLEEQPWFHGVLPREDVQRLLIHQGDYLVRESRSKKTLQTQYVLSVMWTGYKHFIIQGADGNWRFEGEAKATIPELINMQHASNQLVTNKSGAILKTAIIRETWELNNDDIELCEKIGNGNFGDVFRGMYKPENMEVAVKTCRETEAAGDEENKKKFLQEGRILKQYNHEHIVKFIGIAVQRMPIMIVMEYVPGGALLTFLKKRGQDQTTRQLVKMCLDASAGMTYLEDKGCIHRDLAARNCLVGKNNIVKISDFGMSRDDGIYEVGGGMKQIPIKWTAPEALNYGTYTSLCDVWSFGILMWEVFSGGTTPYTGLTNNQAREKIDTGYRLPAPEGTPEIVHKLMLRCWEYEPDDRPHFKEIHSELEKIVKLF